MKNSESSFSFRKSFVDIFNVLATPSEVFTRLKVSPHCGVAFLFVVLTFVLCQWFMIPIIQQPIRHIYVDSFGEEAADSIVSSMTKFFLMIGIGFELGSLLLKWVFFVGIIFLISRIVESMEQNSVKPLFAVVVYSEVIFILMSLVNLLLLYAKGIEQITQPTDMNAIVGLDYFMKDKSSNFPLFTLLSSINIFSLWYLATLSIGVSVVTGLTKLQSVSLVAFFWLSWTLGQIAEPILLQWLM